MLKRCALLLIRFYQTYISPLKGPTCRYYPTCSEYARQAITIHGLWKGLLLASWRLLRCNPLSRGGYDPVPLGSGDRSTRPRGVGECRT
ncbi:MAG TPA: membrane protein insertion efficiency factor YidD [Firmicutes bacterium]|nr:membrane protein insertion efficiency factor YidD [Candidatus Fermentithermobacillaceae bacterium]